MGFQKRSYSLTKKEESMTTAITRVGPGLLGRNVFDTIFDSFVTDMPQHMRQSTQGYPVVDIFQNNEGSTVMEFALAGFSRTDINVEVKPESRSITVSADLTDNTAITNGGTPNNRRIARRSFTKTFVNYDDDLHLTNAEAIFENGLLSIVIPRRPETKPVKIKVQ
jgi:HSP20 family molecular chaperone IbpA